MAACASARGCVALLCLAPLAARNSPEGRASSQQRLENTFWRCSANLSEIKNAFFLKEQHTPVCASAVVMRRYVERSASENAHFME